MTLKEHNRAFALQKRMEADGFSSEFPRVFARCLPSRSEEIDWGAVVAFEAWALTHPHSVLNEALDFLNKVLNHRKAERESITSKIKLEAALASSR